MKVLVIISAQRTIEAKDDKDLQERLDAIMKLLKDAGWDATVDYDEEV